LQIVLPYIAEENHDEDPEVLVKPDQDNATARALKAAIYDQRSQVRGTTSIGSGAVYLPVSCAPAVTAKTVCNSPAPWSQQDTL
jgi:hypothetical protein